MHFVCSCSASVLQKRSYRFISSTFLLVLHRLPFPTLLFFVIWRYRITHNGLLARSFFSNIPRSFSFFVNLYYMRISSRTGSADSSLVVRSGYSPIFSLSLSVWKWRRREPLRWKGKLQRHCWHIAGLYETRCLEGWAGGGGPGTGFILLFL
jgi:hypothetical protein